MNRLEEKLKELQICLDWHIKMGLASKHLENEIELLNFRLGRYD